MTARPYLLPMFKKVTSVLVVDAIEPVLPLWKALGFTPTIEVPHENRLGFVILQSDAVEVMYQTVDSVRADEGKILEGRKSLGASAVYIEVEDVEAVAGRIPRGTDVVVKRRTTFYGATEVILRDAAGNVVTFAQMSAAPA